MAAIPIKGTAGNDSLSGTTGSDLFKLIQGGEDHADGGDGNDTFRLGGALSAGDQIVGGNDDDTLSLKGDYSDPFLMGDDMISNIESLRLNGAYDYNLITSDANIAAGAELIVNAALSGGHALVFNGSAELDGHFRFFASAGNDVLTGGALKDRFVLSHGGNDTAYGGGGQDLFILKDSLDSADAIDGGAGYDTIYLDGDYSGGLRLDPTTIVAVEQIRLAAGHSYALALDAANVTSGEFNMVGNDLGAADTLTFDGSAIGASASLDIGGSNGGDDFLTGGQGDDTINGFGGSDFINLSAGGSDSVGGGEGNDIFYMGAALNAGDGMDGGDDYDTLALDGDYSGGLTVGEFTFYNFEALTVADGNDYDLTTHDGNVASGGTLFVDASALGSSHALTFDGSAETDGTFSITGGAGNDDLTGGAGGDTFDLSLGGNDTVDGGNGDDTINMGAAFTAADVLNGGGGADTVALDGDYSGGLTLTSAMLTNVERIAVAAGHDCSLTVTDGLLALSAEIVVNAGALGSGDSLTFNGAAETDGFLTVTGGAGNDSITGGGSEDYFNLSNGGVDTVSGNGGDDFFLVGAALTAADTIDGGAGSNDGIYLDGDYSAGLTFGTNFTNVEVIGLNGGYDYKLTLNDANLTSTDLYVYCGVNFSAADMLTFNGAAETTRSMQVFGAAAGDIIRCGGGNDDLYGGDGVDLLRGGAGNDDFFYYNASESAADSDANAEILSDFSGTGDRIMVPFATNYVGSVNATANSFADLSATVSASFAGGGHKAVLVVVNGGGLTGHQYLFIDFDDSGSYSGASDLALDLVNMNSADMTGADFGLAT